LTGWRPIGMSGAGEFRLPCRSHCCPISAHTSRTQRPIPRSRPAVLTGTTHMALMKRTSPLLPMVDEFPG
jgi:hypothetical protein